MAIIVDSWDAWNVGVTMGTNSCAIVCPTQAIANWWYDRLQPQLVTWANANPTLLAQIIVQPVGGIGHDNVREYIRVPA